MTFYIVIAIAIAVGDADAFHITVQRVEQKRKKFSSMYRPFINIFTFNFRNSLFGNSWRTNENEKKRAHFLWEKREDQMKIVNLC